MKKNVGELDSIIRSRLGLVLVLVGILGFVGLLQISISVNILLVIIGVISFITGSTKRCGVYSVFGLDTGEDE